MGVHVRFGSFELDEDRAELRRGGEVVRLQPQPFKALLLMVERHGCLVTRDELRRTLWGEGRFVDFDAGLNFCIRQLRAALGDPASHSAVIVAVPRRGYRFVAPIEPVVTSGPIARAREERPPAVRGRAGAAAPWIAAALTSLVAVAVVAVGNSAGRRDAGAADRLRLAAEEKSAQGALGLDDAGPAELDVRIRYFESALADDPSLAKAWAGLADAHLIAGAYRVRAPQPEYARARSAATRALALSPGLADAHAVAGAAALYFAWDWRAAEGHLTTALELDEASPRAHQYYSRLLAARGETDRAIAHARRAVELAPGSASARTDLGQAYFYAGRFGEAVASCDEAAGMLPAFLPAIRCAASAAAEDGAERLAVHYTARLFRTSGDAVPASLTAEGFWQGRARRLEAGADGCGDQDVALAVTLAHLGDYERALVRLERAVDRRNDAMLFANVHPAFRALRSQARFVRTVQRLGLRE